MEGMEVVADCTEISLKSQRSHKSDRSCKTDSSNISNTVSYAGVQYIPRHDSYGSISENGKENPASEESLKLISSTVCNCPNAKKRKKEDATNKVEQPKSAETAEEKEREKKEPVETPAGKANTSASALEVGHSVQEDRDYYEDWTTEYNDEYRWFKGAARSKQWVPPEFGGWMGSKNPARRIFQSNTEYTDNFTGFPPEWSPPKVSSFIKNSGTSKNASTWTQAGSYEEGNPPVIRNNRIQDHYITTYHIDYCRQIAHPTHRLCKKCNEKPDKKKKCECRRMGLTPGPRHTGDFPRVFNKSYQTPLVETTRKLKANLISPQGMDTYARLGWPRETPSDWVTTYAGDFEPLARLRMRPSRIHDITL